MILLVVASHAEIKEEIIMHEWTMTHPYLTFTLALFWILMMNNIIMGISRPEAKSEQKNGSKIDQE